MTEDRDSARRWSAVWKQAAKNHRDLYHIVGGALNDSVDEARAVARRLYAENQQLNKIIEEDAMFDSFMHSDDRIRELEARLSAAKEELQDQKNEASSNLYHAALANKLQAENALLRQALEAVEWQDHEGSGYCPWCHKFYHFGHASFCQRQCALGVKP